MNCYAHPDVDAVVVSILGAVLTLVYLGAGTVGGSIVLGYAALVFVKALAIVAGRKHLGWGSREGSS
ncbi:MAG: hypothetical protein JRN09_02150 [Nitrososphaerota archaeon]|nr:hypothetical protein [Nitrososphaerota archaeon]